MIFSAQPANVVSITTNTTLLFTGETAGTMTATVFGVTGTLTGNNFVPNAVNATGTLFVTLTALASCSILSGCNAFGLGSANNVAARTLAFLAMSPLTLSMYAASGANVNERVRTELSGAENPENYLLYRLADARQTIKFSVLVAAGADVNVATNTGRRMLHAAVHIGAGHIVDLLLSVNGIEVNPVAFGQTPLDNVAERHLSTSNPEFLPIAAALRAAGGVCVIFANNPSFATICTGG